MFSLINKIFPAKPIDEFCVYTNISFENNTIKVQSNLTESSNAIRDRMSNNNNYSILFDDFFGPNSLNINEYLNTIDLLFDAFSDSESQRKVRLHKEKT